MIQRRVRFLQPESYSESGFMEAMMKKSHLLAVWMIAAVWPAWAQEKTVPKPSGTILAPPRVFITVVRPEHYEHVLRGAQQTVQWTRTADIGRPTIEIWKGEAVVQSYPLVTAEGPISRRYRWTWNVPATTATGGDYRVKVISENGRASDFSEYFSVVASKIEISMPRYGSHYRRGSLMTIHFTCYNVTQNLRVYPLNFSNYPIATDISPSTTYVDWPTAGTSPDGEVWMPLSGRIVVSTMDGSVYAESHVFTIDD